MNYQVKAVPLGGWDFGEQSIRLVKVAHDGLRGNDFRDFVKRAGHPFATAMKNIDLKPGDVPAHAIAIGAGEFFGGNRNFDIFPEASCRKDFDTFRKFGRCYRDHANKLPEKSYGYIKQAWYNEKMHRIELLAIYNGTKEAAQRNGGLLADEEVDLLEKQSGEFPGSMATKIPFDLCSSCGHKAKNRKEYCLGEDEGGTCKAGGLRNNIGKYTGEDEHPILGAINPENLWFDWSKVPRGADRTAHTLGILKAASAGGIKLGGAMLAESWGLTLPDHIDNEYRSHELYKLASKLADLEAAVEMAGPDRTFLAFTKSAMNRATSLDALDIKVGEALSAMARMKIVLPVEGFLELIGRDPVKTANAASQARAWLPGIYGRMLRTGELANLLDSSPYCQGETPSRSTKAWADKLAADWSLDEELVQRRALRAALHSSVFPSIKPEMTKMAVAADASLGVAKHYAVYKLAALRDSMACHPTDAVEPFLRAAVIQNYVQD